jgi:archaemetzincin
MIKKIIPHFIFIGFLIITIISSSFNKINVVESKRINVVENKRIVHITPLGNVSESQLILIKSWVKSFYGFNCVIDKQEPLTKDLLAKSQTRYEANKIIKKYKSIKNILLITNVDIAHFNKIKNIKEYGIIGLGYEPGHTCVVSTFRIRKTTEKKFIDRLNKVVLHEIGHNLGLPHCKYDKKCLMNDANGTVKQIDQEKIWLCDNCKKIIGKR